jgi:hypothetical protein
LAASGTLRHFDATHDLVAIGGMADNDKAAPIKFELEYARLPSFETHAIARFSG